MEKWLIQAKKADFKALGEKFGISNITARIIRNRGLIKEDEFEEYLSCNMNELNSPFLLKGMERAVEIIVRAINEKKKIRVIGDYDIDGLCSGYILTTGLERFGAKVDFDVPERIADGYGLNDRLITKAEEDGIDLIITCDNGIAAAKQIAYAKQIGLDVIVTDHHEVPYELVNGEKHYIVPKADAVVDHKQYDCKYPFKELCGAGIAYKVIEAVYIKLFVEKEMYIEVDKLEDYVDKQKFMEEFLVFAAIATIGDIVELLGENRTIVKNGMKSIKTVNNLGLEALIDVNELSNIAISSYHISFVIGPCINAGGRLDTARKAFELFRTTEINEARKKAEELKAINDERKLMTNEFTKNAIDILDADDEMKNQKVIVLYLGNCHESLAGIIAGRIKEIYYKPTFVLTDSADGVKGSGRSVEGYSMYEEMVLADTRYRENLHTEEHLFMKYGGHKMAAGLSIDKNKINEFRNLLNSSGGISDESIVRKIWIDVPLPFEYISENLIEELEQLEPFGKGNEKPVFAEKNVKVNKMQIFGQNRNVISLKLENEHGMKLDGTCFEEEDIFNDYLKNKFSRNEIDKALAGENNEIRLDIIYYPEINEYRGFRNIRVVIKRYS